MSIYDNRTKSAYITKYTYPDYLAQIRPENAENFNILKWWTENHDLLLAESIANSQWLWYTQFAKDTLIENIIKITSIRDIETWVNSDPACIQTLDNNLCLSNRVTKEIILQAKNVQLWPYILWGYIIARAELLDLTKVIRQPSWKTCPLCNEKFVEDSLPIPLIERLGIDNLDFCAPCLRDTVLQGSGNKFATVDIIKKYLRALATTIGRVPSQNFGEGVTDLLNLSKDERVALLILFKRKPTTKRIKELFGSWLNALIQAGVLEDGTRKTSRGIQTIAKDGHICLSLGEKTIDEFLYENGIHHEKEPRYPEGNFRGDFKVGTAFIEYFGLTGNPEYDAKTKEKIRLCEKHNITLVALYPEDLISQKRLENKLSVFVTKM
ncbi:MAG: hypothetical protein WBB69_10905 [Anaerolineales bacterium]